MLEQLTDHPDKDLLITDRRVLIQIQRKTEKQKGKSKSRSRSPAKASSQSGSTAQVRLMLCPRSRSPSPAHKPSFKKRSRSESPRCKETLQWGSWTHLLVDERTVDEKIKKDCIKNRSPSKPIIGQAKFPSSSEIKRDKKFALNKASSLERFVDKYVGKRSSSEPAIVNRIQESRAWIFDTGASIDVINKSLFNSNEIARISNTNDPKTMTGATGKGTTTETVYVPVLNQKTQAKAWIMPECPPTLSLGRRCMLDGYSFHWDTHHPPVLVEPNGRKHTLEIYNYVPFFNEELLKQKYVTAETPQTEHLETSAFTASTQVISEGASETDNKEEEKAESPAEGDSPDEDTEAKVISSPQRASPRKR